MLQQEKEGFPYLPISREKILKVLEGKSEEYLNSLGVTLGLRLMLELGYATQLSKDVYDKLFGNPIEDESSSK